MSTPHLPQVIVAAVDASPESDAALAAFIVDAAATYAESMGARLVILTACPPPPIPSFGPLDPQNVALETMTHLIAATTRHANELLLQLADRARTHGVPTETKAVTAPGRLPDLINDAAAAAVGSSRGLLILASRGRGGLARRVLGSVAELTAHAATMPVMLLPPEETGVAG